MKSADNLFDKHRSLIGYSQILCANSKEEHIRTGLVIATVAEAIDRFSESSSALNNFLNVLVRLIIFCDVTITLKRFRSQRNGAMVF